MYKIISHYKEACHISMEFIDSTLWIPMYESLLTNIEIYITKKSMLNE